MSSPIDTHWLAGLAGQLPLYLAYLLGMVLAVVFWRRCPTPCLLTLLAATFLLLLSVGQPFVYRLFVSRLGTDQGITVVGFVFNLLRAVAYCAIFAAVFVGRSAGQQSWPPSSMPPTGRPGPPPDDRGFTNRPGG